MNLQLLDLENEIWKDVVGYEGYYMVSNLGRVKSLSRFSAFDKNGKRYFKKEKILKQSYDVKGYLRIMLYRESVSDIIFVHRLVLKAFVQNEFNKPFVNHINSIRDDNRVENLEWCTQSENIFHAYSNGNQSKKGTKHHLSKLKEEDIPLIVQLLKDKNAQSYVANLFNVSRSTINDVWNGYSWSHTSGITPKKLRVRKH